jgi:hypothetical protein
MSIGLFPRICALSVPDLRRRQRLGDILVRRGQITRAQLSLALRQQKTDGRRLGEILVANGFVNSSDLQSALQYQWRKLAAAALLAGIAQFAGGAAEAQQARGTKNFMLLNTMQTQQAEAGIVRALDGAVEVISTDGTRRLLQAGETVICGDIIETAAGANAAIQMRDGSMFTIGENSNIALDGFVTGDGAKTAEDVADFVRAGMRFVTAKVSKSLGKATPHVATMGIRG